MTLDVEVAGLRLRYGTVTALDDLSFSLAGGRIYGLLGRNGSGKTSLLSVLAGFRKPSEGRVLVDGQPVYENPAVTSRVCLVRETGDTGDRDERVTDALATAARLRPSWDAAYADRLIDRFQLPRRRFVAGRTVLRERQLGRTKSAMVYGCLDEQHRRQAREAGFDLGPVALQDLFVHLTEPSGGPR